MFSSEVNLVCRHLFEFLSVDGVLPMLFKTSSSPIFWFISAIRRASLIHQLATFLLGLSKANQPAAEDESTYRLSNSNRPKDQIHLLQRESFGFRDTKPDKKPTRKG